MRLADAGRLILTLDGWNELDEASRKRLRAEIKRLKRDFPDIGIIISTRRQVLDVPIAAPTVHMTSSRKISSWTSRGRLAVHVGNLC